MTLTPPSQQFAEALRDYQSGDFTGALQRLAGLLTDDTQACPNWFALLGNVHFKLGNKELAGDAFSREALISADKASSYFKLAIALYAQVVATSKILGLANEAIPHLPGDSASFYCICEAALAEGELDRVAALLPYVDMRNPQHVAMKVHYFRRRQDVESVWTTLEQGVRDCTDDVYLMSMRFAEARTLCNFPVMREYEAIMETPDTPLALGLLAAEMALNRLFWCRSEALISRPSYDSNVLAARTAALEPLRHPRRALSPPGEKLRVAYLSNDFYGHAVMSVFSDVLARHDPDKIELTLLCHTEPGVRDWQKTWPDHLRHQVVRIGDMATVEVLDVIRERQIDILVDLKGHTAGARLDILNLADVPLKVSYLGYPASVTGAELDYAITDASITPDSSRSVYPEKLCLLPGTSMPNGSLDKASPQPTNRSEWGLPEEAFVFCSFNAVFKISPETVQLWGLVLAAVPDSVLWIRCDGDLARKNLIAGLEEAGIDAGRIIFAGATARFQDHINRVALADLSLDTFPYNGHATTTDMLRAGVPVVAVKGTTSPSRMTEGLLRAVGMGDLVAEDTDAFVALAVSLATDRKRLKEVRNRLWKNRLSSPLFDPALFARHLELAYAMMADRARSGLSPDHIVVPEQPAALPFLEAFRANEVAA